MKLAHQLFGACAMLMAASLPVGASTISTSADIAGGTLTDLVPAGQLFTFDDIALPTPIILATGDILHLDANLERPSGPWRVILQAFDAGVPESVHVEFIGKGFREFTYSLYGVGEGGALTLFSQNTYVGAPGDPSPQLAFSDFPNLIDSGSLSVYGLVLDFENLHKKNVKITDIKIGLDAQGVDVAGIPVPAPVALLSIGLGALTLLRRAGLNRRRDV